ncbi:MAG TPA: hypothetical protein VG795_12560 [Acidimicrobiia bacterium]|nr:hypothetical protein [Acidimicrobiia bacterium]
MTKFRALCAALLAALVSGACTAGIDAGHDGGIAFIVFTGMLILTAFILWLVLGRED